MKSPGSKNRAAALSQPGHPEQVAVSAKAGFAVLLNHRCFHGNGPNVGNRDRTLLAYLYRSAWQDQWKIKSNYGLKNKVAALPPHLRRFFDDPNTRCGFDFNHPYKPAKMRSEAPGISPSRWEKE